MKTPIIGIQLYTLRDFIQTAADFDETLARLAAMGVTDVQISAIGDIAAETQAEILKKHGIRVCVTHKSLDRMLNDLPALMQEHMTIGCDAIGLGSCPENYRGSAENARAFIETVRPVAETLAGHGMTFHYHNHDFELRPLPDGSGKTILDVFLEESDPALFRFIPDVAWIRYAGADPVEVLRRMKGRVKVLHFKDYVPDGDGLKFVSLGKGVVDLEACFRAAAELEIPYIMYEQDRDWTDGDPFKATEESWAYMRSLL